ncbi:MAG: hypothetical protein ACOCU4_09880, partial [Alkalispirochaeta sp.]
QDPIFPIAATRAAAEHIQHIYDSAGAPGNVRHVVGAGGHRFYREAWQEFVNATGWVAAGP